MISKNIFIYFLIIILDKFIFRRKIQDKYLKSKSFYFNSHFYFIYLSDYICQKLYVRFALLSLRMIHSE